MHIKTQKSIHHTIHRLKQGFLIFALLLAIPFLLRATTVEELRKSIQNREIEIKKIEAEIAQYQVALENQSGVSQTLKNEIKKLETQIKKMNADIKLTEYQIQNTELKINELGIAINDKEKNISVGKASISELIRTLNESDEQTLIEILLAYRNVADFFEEQNSVIAFDDTLAEKITALKEQRTILDTEQTKHEAQEQILLSYKKDLTGKKNVEESINRTKSSLLKDSKNQETQFQKILTDREKRRAALQNELKNIEAQLQLLIDPKSLPTKGSGVLGWPVANPFITQGFGKTDFATTYGSDIYKGNGHNGIDFRAPIGTKLLSASNGFIKDTGNADAICPGGSYGKWIIIEHPNNLSTLYAHLSLIQVTKGQKVTRGDVIGYSGETGYITGPHLHFTVYASNTYRLTQTQHCGLIPAGGYLNPLDYL
ncbi:MAG: peptidoglycan DD-metalloendopeptidase family protein [Patescibacteria group bacterium]